MIGRKAAVTKVSDGTGYPTNDQKYIGKAYNQVVKIVGKVPNIDLYITDFFMSEYINENNDYVHYGFLKVSRNNVTLLEEW